MANPFILRSEYIETPADEARRAQVLTELDPSDLERVRGGTNNYDYNRPSDWDNDEGCDYKGVFDTDS